MEISYPLISSDLLTKLKYFSGKSPPTRQTNFITETFAVAHSVIHAGRFFQSDLEMAKWGEGDPRWIVEERPDATNVNNWHWTEKNADAWSKKKLTELLVNAIIEEPKVGNVVILEMEKCEGNNGILFIPRSSLNLSIYILLEFHHHFVYLL